MEGQRGGAWGWNGSCHIPGVCVTMETSKIRTQSPDPWVPSGELHYR